MLAQIGLAFYYLVELIFVFRGTDAFYAINEDDDDENPFTRYYEVRTDEESFNCYDRTWYRRCYGPRFEDPEARAACLADPDDGDPFYLYLWCSVHSFLPYWCLSLRISSMVGTAKLWALSRSTKSPWPPSSLEWPFPCSVTFNEVSDLFSLLTLAER